MNRKSYWGIAALIVFVIAAGGFIYWQLSEVQQFKKQLAQEAEELLRQSKKSKKVSQTGNKAEHATGVTAAESETRTAERPSTNGTNPASTKENAPGKTQGGDADTSSPKDTKPVRMSPHGFGPYPEIPEGAPIGIFEETDSRNMELMLRVLVKAWNEGERFAGGVVDDDTGKVYLNYTDVIYVEYSEDIDEETGEKVLSATSIMTAGISNLDYLRAIHKAIKAGNPPAGYTIIDYDKAGIDPYEYLNLPER